MTTTNTPQPSSPYQSQAAETWRLMTASERADKLSHAIDKLVQLTDDAEKPKRVLAHILAQASHLDESTLLTGATGESNELYSQARGKTFVLGTEHAEKLPVLAQVFAALVAGNETAVNCASQSSFVQDMVEILEAAGISANVIYQYVADAEANAEANNETEFHDMLSDHRLAQVGMVGTLAEVQLLAAKLSKTDGILTQVIAITDQKGLSEVFCPEYIHRFCTERVRTINTTAIGGNASLLELGAG